MRESARQFDQFSSEFDLTCASEPARYYAICFTPRSGSHFLGHLMYSTGAMGYPLEYLNPINLARWTELSGSTDIASILKYIESRRTSPNGCFGLKAHLPVVTEYPFDALFPECRMILIERDDLIGQAISLVRARQTNQWISMLPSTGEPHYDFQAIQNAMEEIRIEKRGWTRLLEGRRRHLKVRYESLVADPQLEIGRIAEFLELHPVRIDWERVLPQKQSDAASRVWRERFRQDQLSGIAAS